MTETEFAVECLFVQAFFDCLLITLVSFHRTSQIHILLCICSGPPFLSRIKLNIMHLWLGSQFPTSYFKGRASIRG